MVMILNPHIDGYGEQKPPITVEILRPITESTIYHQTHGNFIKTITDWEDFDDDEPQKA